MRKMMESFEFKSIKWWFVYENQHKEKQTPRNENLVKFSVQLQWQTRSYVYEVAKEI